MRFALYIAGCVLSMTCAGALGAQPVMQPFYPGFAGFPPHEILAIVRSTGLDPVSRPVRQGPVYVLRALSPAGQEVRVVVDGRTGHIVKIAAVAPSDPGAFAPPEAIPSGRVIPDSNFPGPRMTGVPPGADDVSVVDDARPGVPGRAPARVGPKTLPPPLPRPRPKEAAAAASPPSAATTGPSANADNTAPSATAIDE